MIGAVWKLIIFTRMVKRLINTSRHEIVTLPVYDTCLQTFLFSDCEEKTVSIVPRFLLTHAAVLHFFFTKSPRCLKLLIPGSNPIGRWGDHCWIVTGIPAEQKRLIHDSQTAANKTPSGPESPLSLYDVTDRERRREWDCACAINLKNCCFVPCGKFTSACVLKAVMADWNSSNNFDTPCIK
jgi:hypothetical protein